MFYRYELRTTDPAAAKTFYDAVVQRPLRITQLPAQAAARGAPAHWLGEVAVQDVDAALARVLALGAEQRGPVQLTTDGTRRAVVRDPFGAGVALSTPRDDTRDTVVAWHEHLATEREKALALYGELCGWRATDAIDPGLGVGLYQMFAWGEGGESVGAMFDGARRPGVHCQWLYYFAVPELDAALTAVRAGGGIVAHGPRTGPRGARVAVCDDPQGAAFALFEAPTAR